MKRGAFLGRFRPAGKERRRLFEESYHTDLLLFFLFYSHCFPSCLCFISSGFSSTVSSSSSLILCSPLPARPLSSPTPPFSSRRPFPGRGWWQSGRGSTGEVPRAVQPRLQPAPRHLRDFSLNSTQRRNGHPTTRQPLLVLGGGGENSGAPSHCIRRPHWVSYELQTPHIRGESRLAKEGRCKKRKTLVCIHCAFSMSCIACPTKVSRPYHLRIATFWPGQQGLSFRC